MWLHSSAQGGTVWPCVQCSAAGSFRLKKRPKLLEEKYKGKKNPSVDYNPMLTFTL